MRRAAFIGGYDKSDLIVYVAKIISLLSKKVLIIDTTLMQKTRYIVPTMTPAQKYVTTFDGIDIAIGFDSMDDLKDYMGIDDDLPYDYILADFDSAEAYENYEFNSKDIHFFITSFDVFSVQRGLDTLKAFKEPTEVWKVLFTRDPESEEKEYLDFITMNLKVKWNEDVIFFPLDASDMYAIYENQRFSKVRFDNISQEYLDCLAYLTEQAGDLNKGEVRKAIKSLGR